MRTYTLIVPDSSPLITLAMAGALDLLLRPGLTILIPDGVHWEVARDAHLTGAIDIIEWMKRNPRQVMIYPTQEFASHQALIAAGVKRVRGLGERCALEAVEDGVENDPDARGILLYEDSDIRLLSIVNTDKIDTLTTADFLAELERLHLIQSADQILDQAVEAGRNEGVRRRSGT